MRLVSMRHFTTHHPETGQRLRVEIVHPRRRSPRKGPRATFDSPVELQIESVTIIGNSGQEEGEFDFRPIKELLLAEARLYLHASQWSSIPLHELLSHSYHPINR